MKVKVGELDLLHSGSMLQHNEAEIELLVDNDDPHVTIRCVFVGPSCEVKDLTLSIPSPTELVIRLPGSIPIAIAPTYIGTTENRELYIALSSVPMGIYPNINRNFTYSLYLGVSVEIPNHIENT